MAKVLTSLIFTLLFCTTVFAYPAQFKVNGDTVNVPVYTQNNELYVSVPDMCLYLKWTYEYTDSYVKLINYTKDSSMITTFMTVENVPYISLDYFVNLGCTYEAFEATNVHTIQYTPREPDPTPLKPASARASLLYTIHHKNFTPFNTKTLLIQAFNACLSDSEQGYQTALRLSVQKHIEYLEGINTSTDVISDYRYNLLKAAEEQNEAWLPEVSKYWCNNTMQQLKINNAISDEQSMENILTKSLPLEVNEKFTDVARTEVLVRHLTTQQEKANYIAVRDYLYMKLR